MLYSKRRKNLGGGLRKRSNRKSYGLKRYSKNIANISGYQQKGGGMSAYWTKILNRQTMTGKEYKDYCDKLYNEYKSQLHAINTEYDIDPSQDDMLQRTSEELKEQWDEELATLEHNYSVIKTALDKLKSSVKTEKNFKLVPRDEKAERKREEQFDDWALP